MSNHYHRGFTLIEIIIVTAILGIILSLGLFIGVDFFRSYSLRSEENVIVSVLQKARGQSINNINEKKHGVHFEVSPDLKYIIFEGPSYDPSNPTNTIIKSAYGITISGLPIDIIFEQLSGNCVSCASPVEIKVNDGVREYAIKINSEGQIDW